LLVLEEELDEQVCSHVKRLLERAMEAERGHLDPGYC
jgi:hypothetical protein